MSITFKLLGHTISITKNIVFTKTENDKPFYETAMLNLISKIPIEKWRLKDRHHTGERKQYIFECMYKRTYFNLKTCSKSGFLEVEIGDKIMLYGSRNCQLLYNKLMAIEYNKERIARESESEMKIKNFYDKLI